MKNAIALLALVVASAAHAEVKRPGTFVPERCTFSREAYPHDVCLGRKVGMEGKYIAFETIAPADGVLRILAKVTEKRPGLGHEWMSSYALVGRAEVDPADAISYRQFNGREFKLLVKTYSKFNGVGRNDVSVSFLIDNQVEIQETSFQPVMVTQ